VTLIERLGGSLLVATTNPNKVREIRQIVNVPGLRLTTLADVPALEAPEETGTTFEANARLKAEYYSKALGVPCLAEDSGLEIDALKGAPGVHSARFMGVDTPYPERMRHLLLLLSGAAEGRRTARYRSAVVLVWPDGTEVVAEGSVEGRIAPDVRGTGGFGYDPVFLVPEYGQTFGELSAKVKNQMSHRGRSLQALLEKLKQPLPV
jgi:XTP/dITP diphosphohydrolase